MDITSLPLRRIPEDDIKPFDETKTYTDAWEALAEGKFDEVDRIVKHYPTLNEYPNFKDAYTTMRRSSEVELTQAWDALDKRDFKKIDQLLDSNPYLKQHPTFEHAYATLKNTPDFGKQTLSSEDKILLNRANTCLEKQEIKTAESLLLKIANKKDALDDGDLVRSLIQLAELKIKAETERDLSTIDPHSMNHTEETVEYKKNLSLLKKIEEQSIKNVPKNFSWSLAYSLIRSHLNPGEIVDAFSGRGDVRIAKTPGKLVNTFIDVVNFSYITGEMRNIMIVKKKLELLSHAVSKKYHMSTPTNQNAMTEVRHRILNCVKYGVKPNWRQVRNYFDWHQYILSIHKVGKTPRRPITPEQKEAREKMIAISNPMHKIRLETVLDKIADPSHTALTIIFCAGLSQRGKTLLLSLLVQLRGKELCYDVPPGAGFSDLYKFDVIPPTINLSQVRRYDPYERERQKVDMGSSPRAAFGINSSAMVERGIDTCILDEGGRAVISSDDFEDDKLNYLVNKNRKNMETTVEDIKIEHPLTGVLAIATNTKISRGTTGNRVEYFEFGYHTPEQQRSIIEPAIHARIDQLQRLEEEEEIQCLLDGTQPKMKGLTESIRQQFTERNDQGRNEYVEFIMSQLALGVDPGAAIDMQIADDAVSAAKIQYLSGKTHFGNWRATVGRLISEKRKMAWMHDADMEFSLVSNQDYFGPRPGPPPRPGPAQIPPPNNDRPANSPILGPENGGPSSAQPRRIVRSNDDAESLKSYWTESSDGEAGNPAVTEVTSKAALLHQLVDGHGNVREDPPMHIRADSLDSDSNFDGHGNLHYHDAASDLDGHGNQREVVVPHIIPDSIETEPNPDEPDSDWGADEVR